MTLTNRTRITLMGVLAVVATVGPAAHPQESHYPKQTQLPNPYRLVEGWPTLPKSMNGGQWGELIRADIDPKGNIWVFHRCFNTEPAGAATCVGRSEPPILEFDPVRQASDELWRRDVRVSPWVYCRWAGKRVGKRRKCKRDGTRYVS